MSKKARPARWRVLAVTSLITAAVTAAVTLAFAGLGPLWRAVFPEPPVSVYVERHQPPAAPGRPRGVRAKAGEQQDWDRHAWALPAVVEPADVPRLDDPGVPDPWSALSDWATRAGGGDVGSTRIRVTVTGQDKEAVIDGLCAHLVGPRADPLSGTLVHVQPDGETPEPATLDLDADRPCSPELSRAPVHVAAHRSTVIDVSALTRAHSVAWYPELRLVVDGERQTIPVGANRPYRTTALLDDLAGYQRYIVYARSASAFMESLPDPSELKYIGMYAYGSTE